jgi:hypothetical protein
MKFILTFVVLTFAQALQPPFCEINGPKKTHYRGSALYEDMMLVADCYNYRSDSCPQSLEVPSSDDPIFQKCKHNQDSESGGKEFHIYRCDEFDNLFDWQSLFRSKGWDCDDIH